MTSSSPPATHRRLTTAGRDYKVVQSIGEGEREGGREGGGCDVDIVCSGSYVSYFGSRLLCNFHVLIVSKQAFI